jgi:DNA-binding transcriptional ArsR family regulator
MSLLPSSPEVSVEDDPRVVGLDSEEADALMRALSSDTAREMLSALHEEPMPPSRLADRVDTTLQNAQYHLERLADAGAIEVVGTAYSEKGREMDVYAPADKPLVIFAGRDDQASGLRSALRRLVGGLFALLFGAVAVQELFGGGIRRLVEPFAESGERGAGGAGGAAGDGGDGGDLGANYTAQSATETPTGPTDTTTSGGDDVGILGGESVDSPTATPSGGGGGAGGATPVAGDGGATATPATTPSGTPVDTVTATDEAARATATPINETATETVRTATEVAAGQEAAVGLPPGLAFFLGGALVLGVAVALSIR